MKKIVLITLLIGTALQCYSANQDTLSLKLDTPLFKPLQNVKPNLHKSMVLNYAIPAICIGYGFYSLDNDFLEKTDRSINTDMREDHPRFKTNIDDQLQYAPMVAVYGLNLLGVKSTHNFIDKTAIYTISNTLMGMSAGFLKTKTHKLRPSGGGRSFPSGHTATAFVAAEFIRQEFKDVSPWYGFAGYTVAVATGSLRMLNNAHWFSDVVAGAGVGIATTKLTYLVYPLLKKNLLNNTRTDLIVTPTMYQGKPGIYVVWPL